MNRPNKRSRKKANVAVAVQIADPAVVVRSVLLPTAPEARHGQLLKFPRSYDLIDIQAEIEGTLLRRAYRPADMRRTVQIKDCGSFGDVTGPTRRAASSASPQNSDTRGSVAEPRRATEKAT